MTEMKPYPILYARIGSSVKKGVIFSSVFDKNSRITDFVAGSGGSSYLSGQSRYIHSDKMNQGSFGVSGSYGVSGIMKVDASVSAYVGNAAAQSDKDVRIYFNAFITLGKEQLSVNSLGIGDLLNAMAPNPKRACLQVLKNYNALIAKLDDGASVDAELRTWSQSVDNFINTYGESIVVGIHWGAFGAVQFHLSESNSTSSWNYGAEASFSYATAVASVSVKAAYSGNQSTAKSDVNVEVLGFYKGDSISDIIGKIVDSFNGKAFTAIADQNLSNLNGGQKLEIPANLRPEAPAFITPKEDAAVTAELGKVKDIDKLSVVEKGKQELDSDDKTDPVKPITNDQLEKIDKKVLIAGANEKIKQTIKNAKGTTRVNSLAGKSAVLLGGDSGSVNLENDPIVQDGKFGKDFVPLGVVLSSWGDLLPWFVQPSDNRILNTDSITDILAWRTMIQDGLSLSMIYYTAANIKLKISETTQALQMANEFSQLTANLQSLDLNNKKDPDGYIRAISNAYMNLGTQAKAIYDKWAEIGFLRKAELGLGIIDLSMGPSNSLNETKSYDGPGSVPLAAKSVNITPCSFDPSTHNYSVFSSFIKLLPIILPDDGSVCAFNQDGFYGTFLNTKWNPS